MFGTHDLTLFITAGLLLNIAPGPDSVLIMAEPQALNSAKLQRGKGKFPLHAGYSGVLSFSLSLSWLG